MRTSSSPSSAHVVNSAGLALARKERGWNRATVLLVVLYPAVITAMLWFDARRLPPLLMLLLQPFIHLADLSFVEGQIIKAAGRECHMLPDGTTVPVDEHTAHEPDALVYCGNKVPGSTLKIENPVIVVEVLSPTTRHVDASTKLSGYIQLPSVHHYLIVDPEDRPTIHHQRGTDGKIATSIVPGGRILLDPPGIEVEVAAFFE